MRRDTVYKCNVFWTSLILLQQVCREAKQILICATHSCDIYYTAGRLFCASKVTKNWTPNRLVVRGVIWKFWDGSTQNEIDYPVSVKMVFVLSLKCSTNVIVECLFSGVRWIKNWNKEFCFKTEESTAETYELLKTSFGDKCSRWANVFICFNKFLNDRESVDDDPDLVKLQLQ